MKTIYQTALLLKNNLPAPKYKLFLSSLTDDERLLLDHCLSDTYDTDFELAPAVFGIKSKAVKYQRLKKNLQEKIYDFTLFARPKTVLNQEHYDNHYDIIRVSHLMEAYRNLFNRPDLSYSLTKKYFKFAYDNFYHQIVIVICEISFIQYGVRGYDEAKLKFFKKIYEESIIDYSWECKSKLYFQSINTQFSKRQKLNKTKLLSEIEEYLIELSPHENNVRSFVFHSNFYGLQMIYYHINNNYLKVVDICDTMILYLDMLPIKVVGYRRLVLRRKALHLIWLKNYESALVTLNEVSTMEIEDSSGWVNTKYLYILISIYKKNYTDADLLIKEIIKSKLFDSSKSLFIYDIKIIKIFLHLFKLMGAISTEEDKISVEIKKHFREYKNFTLDKSGNNIPLFIAQLLEAIVQRKEDDIIDRMEALKKYTSRYITQSSHLRSNCFIHMLLAVVKHNYHVAAIERHTKKYVDKLRDNPKINTEEPVEVELIPYEDIWAILMTYLSNIKNLGSKK